MAHCVIRRDGTLSNTRLSISAPCMPDNHVTVVANAAMTLVLALNKHRPIFYTDKQYQCLVEVTGLLLMHYQKLNRRRIIGHEHIAPGRKTDPGSGFDWPRYLNQL